MTNGRATRLTIDLAAIAHNASALCALAPAGARVMAVVKANAYGHGDVEVAQTALRHGCGALAVAIPGEGARLRAAGLAAPILILGAPEPEGASLSVAHDLCQTVFLPEQARWIAAEARRQRRVARVQIKIDTGMSRLGLSDSKALCLLASDILAEPWLRLEGAYTHLANADDPDDDFALEQLRRFDALASGLRALAPGLPLHAANSAGLIRFPQAAYDWVRTGIALYGAPPMPCPTPLKQAMRWTTRASYVKTVPGGATVGYGRTYRAAEDLRVMTLPVGYADGYLRALSGKAQVLVAGRRAPLLGRVCMDQCMADVTAIPEAAVGDEVVLLGGQGEEFIGADELAGWAGTISYEVMCAVSPRVTRTVLPEDGHA